MLSYLLRCMKEKSCWGADDGMGSLEEEDGRNGGRDGQ